MLINIAFDLLLTVFTISSTLILTILASYLIFWIDARYLQLDLVTNLSQQQIWHNYQQVMDYLTHPWVAKLKMTNFFSSAAGLEHFSEVRLWFMVGVIMWLVSLLLLVWWQKRGHFQQKLWINQYFIVILGLGILVLALLAIIDFDGMFTIFHHLLFWNNDWLFDPNKDPVINILPASFFAHCFLFGFIVCELMLLSFWFQSRRLFKTHRK